MRILPLVLIMLSSLTGALGNGERTVYPLSQWDVEGMFVQAKAMLEDRSIQNVDGVPMMLETCAREGHFDATLLLMDVYEGRFKGLDANPERAALLAQSLAEAAVLDSKGAEGRNLRTEAMYRLALYREKGKGCKLNQKEAYKWMELAARRNMAPAAVEQARYLINGTGVSRNPKLAWKLLYHQAIANPRTPHLFFYMGYMCFKGLGMPRNARKAFELFRMGAKLGDAQCLNNLGTMFEKGYPSPRDEEAAYHLYRRAAELGNKEASANMQRLAFKEGIRASHLSATPYRKRIDNATLHIIQALPVSSDTRSRLSDWLLFYPSPEEES